MAGSRERGNTEIRRRRKRRAVGQRRDRQAAVVPTGPVAIPPQLTVAELGVALGVTAVDVVRQLVASGQLVAINETIPFALAERVATALRRTVVPEETLAPERERFDGPDAVTRPPVVTVLGHVDHGKTRLIRSLRAVDEVQQEAGGITQAIGASRVTHHGRTITLLDTPGHEAFSAMRSRGAHVTDVAVLVIAADDGIKPQTLEAIDHARAAGVPIVVAITKIDLPGADPERIRGQLAEVDLIPESYGGTVPVVEVSAREGLGVEELIDLVQLVADLEELRANPNAPARGAVIESRIDASRGVVATLLVLDGTLSDRDIVVAGGAWGRVRALRDDHGRRVRSVPPGVPVEMLGLARLPESGDRFAVVADEREARAMSERLRSDIPSASRRGAREATDELRLIVKADSQGSLGALVDGLDQLLRDEHARLLVVHRGVGPVSQSDVHLAAISGATIFGFSSGIEPIARRLADERGVEVRLDPVIYALLDAARTGIHGGRPLIEVELLEGRAEVRQRFGSSTGAIAGCRVSEGVVRRGTRARVVRDEAAIFTGEVTSLRRFKENVANVEAGHECGILLTGFDDWQPGDLVETYRIELVPGGRPAGAPERPA